SAAVRYLVSAPAPTTGGFFLPLPSPASPWQTLQASPQTVSPWATCSAAPPVSPAAGSLAGSLAPTSIAGGSSAAGSPLVSAAVVSAVWPPPQARRRESVNGRVKVRGRIMVVPLVRRPGVGSGSWSTIPARWGGIDGSGWQSRRRWRPPGARGTASRL